MKVLDLTCPTPAENLACDEALLLDAEEGSGGEVLRLWEPAEPFVVLGHGSRAEREVALGACRSARVPVLRRPSGGATVLQGPGCLNYALVLDVASRGLTEVAATNAYVMRRLKNVVEPLMGAPVAIEGFTDLTIGGRKFSGNSQYRKKRALLFHGCFLIDCDIDMIGKLLLSPARQPVYRRQRPHGDFLTNLHVAVPRLKAALREAWLGGAELREVPFDAIDRLVQDRYSKTEWNFRL